jgi:hypothetical protein
VTIRAVIGPRSGQSENSPAIYRWVTAQLMKPKSATRTTELVLKHPNRLGFCRPFHGLCFHFTLLPSTEVLGYFQIVRFADEPVDDKVNA